MVHLYNSILGVGLVWILNWKCFCPAGNDAGSADSSAAEGDLHYYHTTPTSHQTPVLHNHVHRPAPKTHCNPANPGRAAVTKDKSARYNIYHYIMDLCAGVRLFFCFFVFAALLRWLKSLKLCSQLWPTFNRSCLLLSRSVYSSFIRNLSSIELINWL